jgi:hypothetical protein
VARFVRKRTCWAAFGVSRWWLVWSQTSSVVDAPSGYAGSDLGPEPAPAPKLEPAAAGCIRSASLESFSGELDSAWSASARPGEGGLRAHVLPLVDAMLCRGARGGTGLAGSPPRRELVLSRLPGLVRVVRLLGGCCAGLLLSR